MSEQFGHSISPPPNKRADNGPELPEFLIGRRSPVKNPGASAAKAGVAKSAGSQRTRSQVKTSVSARMSAAGRSGASRTVGYRSGGAEEGPILGGGGSGGGRRVRRKKLNRARAFLVAAVSALCLMLGALVFVFLSEPPGGAQNDQNAQGLNSASGPDSGKFHSGVVVDGFDIGNLTYAEAKSKVEPVAVQKLESIGYTLSLGGKEYTLDRDDIKANVDYDAVLHEAFDVGRASSVFDDTGERSNARNGVSFETELTYDQTALRAALEEIGTGAYVAPVEPHAVVNNEQGDRFKFEAGENGSQIDIDALAQKLEGLLQAEEYSASLEVPTSEVRPTHTIDDVKQNTNKVDGFTTYFTSSAGSKPERVFNIEKAARIIDGAEIKPGEEWSFNEFVGPRTVEGGWKEAPGIVNGNMYEMQAGGGICQVSTTLYNAALKSDLEIVSSKRHSWPSAYVDYGLDATVSTGGPDLVIKNNKDYSVFFFTSVNTAEKSMTVNVYGPNTLGSDTQIQLYSEIIEEIEPEESKIVEDSEMPTGYKETLIEERTGYVCEVFRDFVQSGKVVKTEKLYSHKYRAVQGSLRIGTGDKTSLDPNPMPSA